MKQLLLLLPFALVVGCGPAAQPPPAAAKATATPPPAVIPTQEATTAPAPIPAPTATPTAPNTATETAPKPPPEPDHSAPPNLKGTLGGKPFVARYAVATTKTEDGRVLVEITDFENACVRMEDAKEGERTFSMYVEWKPGEVAFTGSKPEQEPFYSVMGKRQKAKRTDVKPKGKVELFSAPIVLTSHTRLKVNLTDGKDTSLEGDIRLLNCWGDLDAPDGSKQTR